jgi:hypothetical protein
MPRPCTQGPFARGCAASARSGSLQAWPRRIASQPSWHPRGHEPEPGPWQASRLRISRCGEARSVQAELMDRRQWCSKWKRFPIVWPPGRNEGVRGSSPRLGLGVFGGPVESGGASMRDEHREAKGGTCGWGYGSGERAGPRGPGSWSGVEAGSQGRPHLACDGLSLRRACPPCVLRDHYSGRWPARPAPHCAARLRRTPSHYSRRVCFGEHWCRGSVLLACAQRGIIWNPRRRYPWHVYPFGDDRARAPGNGHPCAE